MCKNTGILHTAGPAGRGLNFGILADSPWPPVAKHGEFAVFYRVLGRALYARILAESSFVRKGQERVGRMLTNAMKCIETSGWGNES